jgi:hypothetical protein
MKTTYLNQLTRSAKRAHAWAKILPASQIVKPITGVLRHVATTAY